MPLNISTRVASLPPSGIRRFFDLAASTSDAISLGVGEPEGPTPWVIRDQAIHALRQGWTHYTSNRGILELRESISRDLNRLYGVDYNPETQLLVTCGVSQAFDIALRCLVEPGDDVLVIEPAYVA